MSTGDSITTVDAHGRPSGSADGPAPARAAAPGRETLKRLAQEFEAALLNEMLAGWRQALISEDDESGSKSGLLADLVGTEFGRAISCSGGFGIADVVIRELRREYAGAGDREPQNPQPDDSRVSTTSPSARIASLVGAATTGIPAAPRVPMLAARTSREADRVALTPAIEPASGGLDQVEVHPVGGVVTSAFGWRTDPFSGRAKFHSGADVRMAYGQEVTSVAAGRVTFAGDRAGYGLTVVVDHGEGRETRYAHLSSASVRVGDVVGKGAVIARSGNSGRSTGPHLHVELYQDGRAVDPSGLFSRLNPEVDGRW